MTQKIRKYFSHESNISKVIFSLVIVAVFGLVFGQSAFAEFTRLATGSSTFGYGYGYGSSGYGYGYGYGAGGNGDYGFYGASDAATLGTPVPSQTSFTVTALTDYLAEISLNSGAYETAFATGTRALSVSGLTCNTAYSFTVNAKDAGGNVYPTSGTVTTSACSSTNTGSTSSGGGGGGWGYVASTTTCPVGYTCTPMVVQTCPTGYTCTRIANYNGLIHSSWTRDLKIGLTGDDVYALQVFLNGHGFMVAPLGAGSPGHETSFFGSLTQKALIKFQKANNIKPSVGYFGPITRAFIANLLAS